MGPVVECDLIGEDTVEPSTRQSLTCLVPTVTRFLPIHAICEMLLVHLLLA